MGLLLTNALKGLKRKKIQMFGIVMMLVLSTGIYVAMNTALDRLETKYYDYLDEQNVENVSVDVLVDYKDLAQEDITYMLDNYFQKASEEEIQLVKSYTPALAKESPEYLAVLTKVFTKYEADTYLKDQVLASIQDEYAFDFELERSKTLIEESKITKIIPLDLSKKINKPYLREGRFPAADHEISMLEGFAKANHLKIGDTYKIGEKEFTIVGFTYASDYIYPMISFSAPIFDEEENNIIFMMKTPYEEINGIVDNSYAIKFRGDVKRKFEFEIQNTDDGTVLALKDDPMTYLFENAKDKVAVGMNTITRITRIGSLQLEFIEDRLFAEYFLYMLLAIAVVIIMIITKKRIDDERLQIGVLKSLGYSKYSIAFSYLVYPVIGSIIGGLLGFIIGSLLNAPLASMFLGFFNVPLDGFSVSISYLSKSIFIPLLVLSILCYLIALFMLRKKPLALLKEGSNLRVNIFSKLVNFFTRVLPFKQRFKYSLAARSLGKLLIVTITAFGSGLLIVLTLIGFNLFNDAIEQAFEGMKYDSIVYLNNYYEEDTISDKEDHVLSMNMVLKEIRNQKGEKQEHEKLNEEEDVNVSFSGVDTDSKYIEILDEKKNDQKPLLQEKKLIASSNLKDRFSLEEGYSLVFTFNEQEYVYEIVGFSNDFMSLSVYMEREALSKDLGFLTKKYNVIYSNDTKYQSMSTLPPEDLEKVTYIMSLKDLKDNILKQMDRYNGSIYIIVAFASVMAFIIISVIASIIVEENKKTISLMKVMGYKNKEVSSIVLNIYTPFVVLAYLLSIPVMKAILKWIVKSLSTDTEMSIPITLSFVDATIGLVGLLVAYYIAIFLSKKVLNKVPLAVALKRE